jgi:hypothetical protein
MATTNDQTQLVGDFIDQWGSNVVELFKFMAPLASRIGFESANLIGGKYHQAVDLQTEQGFTYAAAGSTPTLLAAVAGYMGDAQVEGSQIYGRSLVAYEAIMRSQQEGKQAVKNATKYVVRRLGRSGTKRLEIDILHGRIGIGTLSGISGTSTTRVLTISDASWSAGIWAGAENATLDARRTNSTYADTKINANAAIVVTAVNMTAKQISVSGNATDLTALDSYAANNGYLFFETSSPTTSMAGLTTISTNTGSLFNISAATYALWGGNTYSTSTGIPSMAKFLDALSIAASFGLQGMKATAIVSPKCFEVLNSDQAALRDYDVSYRPATGESGFEGLMYHGQTGPLEILPHPFQMDGQAHIICEEEMHRIGASDLSFVDRGGPSPRLILESANSPSSEMRIQSHQAIYSEAPRHMVYLGGITYG